MKAYVYSIQSPDEDEAKVESISVEWEDVFGKLKTDILKMALRMARDMESDGTASVGVEIRSQKNWYSDNIFNLVGTLSVVEKDPEASDGSGNKYSIWTYSVQAKDLS